MEAPNPNKRLASSSSSSQMQNPNSNDVDRIVSSFLLLPDSPTLSSPVSIACSFDRVLEKLFEASSGDDDYVQERLTDRGFKLAYLLHESTNKFARRRTTIRNSISWPLPHELTVKVFSVLDTKSLMQASSCCTMLNKCAMDPLCYSHIDLTPNFNHVDDEVVSSMIRNAGKELRSLKVGRILPRDVSTTSLLTGSCLAPLSSNHGLSGSLLETLHLYSHRWLDNKSLRDALSACSNLTDLKIVGLVDSSEKVLESLSRKCKHLFVEPEFKHGMFGDLYSKTPFWRNCPDITSLSLIGFLLNDSEVFLLIKSFRKLKYLNLSKTFGISGSFLSIGCKDTLLETLILRDCLGRQEEVHILLFLESLLEGNFMRFIRHIDVSRSWSYCKPKFPLEQLKEERPGLTFVADFTGINTKVDEEIKELNLHLAL